MTSTASTTTTTAPAFRINRNDRLSTIATIVLTAIALIAGLLLRNGVESRTRAYQDPSGVVLHYPDHWRLNTAEAAQGVVSVRDINAQDFPTTLELRTVIVEPSAQDIDALALAASQVALNRGRSLTAFRMFDIVPEQTFKELPGATASFVFVSDAGSVVQESLPAVVLGDEILVRKGSTVYVFSLLSTEGNRSLGLAALRAFVDSAQLP